VIVKGLLPKQGDYLGFDMQKSKGISDLTYAQAFRRTASLLGILVWMSFKASAMVFPQMTEPYDHNYNLWTSEDSVSSGYPEAILDGTPGYAFQGTPIAPQYLVTAAHLSGYFTQVEFNGTTYQIAEQIVPPSSSVFSDTMLVKINGSFSSYAQIVKTPPLVGDTLVMFGSGWSAGPAIKDAGGNIRGW